jgi:hypothetical protein
MITARLAGECAHATARAEEVPATGAEPLSLPEQELVGAAFWWLGGFDARVTWSLWADWATEHEMV